MKTIVISGASSKVGKTTLSLELCELLPRARAIKIGHGKEKPGKGNFFYASGTPVEKILAEHTRCRYLIIESNSVLRNFDPDIVIYLHGKNPKPSSVMARERADIISGTLIETEKTEQLARKLGLAPRVMSKIIWLAGARTEPTTAIILAGGENTRMGREKACLMVHGKTLLQRHCQMFAEHFDEIVISCREPMSCSSSRVKMVVDKEKGKGPLMGIFAGLKASANRLNFIIACDIPDVDLSVLRRLFSESADCDIVVPSFKKDRIEPLFAIYRKDVALLAQDLVGQGILRVSELFDRCKTKNLRFHKNDWYFNLNTPGEYGRYLNYLQADTRCK